MGTVCVLGKGVFFEPLGCSCRWVAGLTEAPATKQRPFRGPVFTDIHVCTWDYKS